MCQWSLLALIGDDTFDAVCEVLWVTMRQLTTISRPWRRSQLDSSPKALHPGAVSGISIW